MSSRQRDVIRAHLGMLLWAVIVGLSFPLVGMITEGLPPLLLTALRFLLAAAVILPMLLPRREPLPKLRALFFYSLLGLCLACFFGAMFWAAARSSALSMAVPTSACHFSLISWGFACAWRHRLSLFRQSLHLAPSAVCFSRWRKVPEVSGASLSVGAKRYFLPAAWEAPFIQCSASGACCVAGFQAALSSAPSGA